LSLVIRWDFLLLSENTADNTEKVKKEERVEEIVSEDSIEEGGVMDANGESQLNLEFIDFKNKMMKCMDYIYKVLEKNESRLNLVERKLMLSSQLGRKCSKRKNPPNSKSRILEKKMRTQASSSEGSFSFSSDSSDYSDNSDSGEKEDEEEAQEEEIVAGIKEVKTESPSSCENDEKDEEVKTIINDKEKIRAPKMGEVNIHYKRDSDKPEMVKNDSRKVPLKKLMNVFEQQIKGKEIEPLPKEKVNLNTCQICRVEYFKENVISSCPTCSFQTCRQCLLDFGSVSPIYELNEVLRKKLSAVNNFWGVCIMPCMGSGEIPGMACGMNGYLWKVLLTRRTGGRYKLSTASESVQRPGVRLVRLGSQDDYIYCCKTGSLGEGHRLTCLGVGNSMSFKTHEEFAKWEKKHPPIRVVPRKKKN